MVEQQPKADPTPEDVRHAMQTTRARLGAGMHALGDKAAGYARDAADAVGDAYRGTMDAVHGVQHAAADGAAFASHAVADATAFAGRALGLRRHVRRRPWLAVAVAVTAGCACGRLFARR